MNARQRYEYLAESLGKWVLVVADEPVSRDRFFDLPGTKARLEALRIAEAECGFPRAG